ncbi:MAG: beta strand repeat-containing protein [Thermaurantimonas sp.]|uniref:beta strand repeat-containing protein n=1 Tax=Thermaurantimonas sp. TaxID=2681568 RepID=UPI0039190C60
MKKVYLSAFLALLSWILHAQLTGIKNIPGDYANLAAAIADLNTNGVGTGGVTFNVTANQTAPAGGYVIGGSGSAVLTTASASNPIIFNGFGNTVTAPNPQATGSLTDAIFKLIGADFVTIENFVLQENSANTVNTPATSNNMTEWGIALLYVTTTDGCQNITIKNNTISLNRTYTNTFGIYSNSTHSATAVTVSATATGPTGGNHNLTIIGNTISNVNQGIVVIGPTAAADQNTGMVIGGSAANGNTINNYGTAAQLTSFNLVSGTMNGIHVRNTNGYTISHNSIESSTAVSSGTVRGIFAMANSSAPIGTFTNNINNNSIAVRGTGAAILQGINCEATTATATSTLNINNNNFTSLFGHTGTASGAVTYIINAGTHLNQSISDNTFTNQTLVTTGSVTLISNSNTLPSGGTKNVNNNSIVTGFNKTGAGGTVTLIFDNSVDPTGTTNNMNGNTFSNISITGATTFVGIQNTNGGSPTKNVNNNVISNITGGSSAITLISINFDGGTTTVSNNQVHTVTSSGAITGISFGTTGAGTTNCFLNTIHSLSSTGNATVTALALSGTTTSGVRNAYRNKIYDITVNNSGASALVNGILISGGFNVNVYNNLVGNLFAPASNVADAIRGISITSASTNTTYNVIYNTVFIQATSTGTTFGTTGIFHAANATATTATLNLRNNIIVNKSTPNGTGLTVAFRRSAGTANTLNNYASTSNNNLFYAGTPGPNNLIYADGTSTATTLSAYKSGVFTAGTVAPRDNLSVTEDVTFVSTVGSSTDFLTIDATVPTQIESGAAPITSPFAITTDFNDATRSATTPDIGAFEGSYTLLDLTPPSISYFLISNGIVASTRVLTGFATITDVSGVNTTAGTRPRIYYKKSTDPVNDFNDNTSATQGWKFAEASNTSSPFDFTIDYTRLFGGSVSVGDVIQYFVVAQDLAPTPNVGINSGTFASTPTSVALVSANFPITGTINSYNIVTPLSGTVTVGTGGTYPTLTGTGGLFEAINNSALNGDLIAEVLSDITEPGTVALNNIGEVPPGGYTVTIRPDNNVVRNITGNLANGLIRLNGADRVIIDGRYSGSGQFLRFVNSNNSSTAAVIWMISPTAGNGASNNVVRNCIVEGGFATGTLAGVISSGPTLGGVGAEQNSNNLVTENTFRKLQHAVAFVGPTSGDNNNVISKNTIGGTTTADTIGFIGIFVSNQNNVLVTENDIVSIEANAGNNNPAGITVAGAHSGGAISRNIVRNVYNFNTGQWGASGIHLSSSSSSTNLIIANNVITNIRGLGWPSNQTDNGIGIRISAGGGYTIAFNSINLNLNQPTAANSHAIFSNTSTTNNTLINNVIANTQTTGSRWAVYINTSTNPFSTINFNNYFSTQNVGFLSSNRATLADWRTATGQDQLSISRNPNFTSATNLLPTDFNGYFAQPVSGITTDFTGATRSTVAPAKGAFEGPVPGVWLGGTSSWTSGTNWADGNVPTATTLVAILNSTVTQPVITTSVTNTEMLAVASGCTLTVGNGGALTADSLRLFGNITLDASASGYGSLIEGNVIGSGTISRRMYLNASSGPNNGRWYTIGSPFAVPINQLHDGTSEFNVTNAIESPFRLWNAGTGDYELPTGPTMNFERGRGYVAFFGEFVGSTFIRPVPGNITVTGNYGSAANLTRLLGYTAAPTFPTIDGPTDGWNLLSNPYLTSYDWNGQTLGPNTGAAIYVRNAANTGWVTWNTSETSNRRYIPPMQGFWIRTTASENLTFDIAQRSTNSTQVIEKPSAQELLTRIKVTNTATGHDDRAVISFHTNGTNGFDRLLDGYKLRNDAGMHNVYSRSQNMSLAMNYLPSFSGSASVPVWFENDQPGSYTFSINRDDIDPNVEITLEDKQTNTTFTFQSSQSVYAFTHTPQMSKDRFILHYNQINVGQDEITSRGGIKGLQAWYFDGRINLKSLGFHGPVTARLVDVSGKRIAEEVLTISTGELTRWNVPGLKPGVYMVQLITREGQTTVKFVY